MNAELLRTRGYARTNEALPFAENPPGTNAKNMSSSDRFCLKPTSKK